MRRPIFLIALALVIGFGLGLLFNYSLISASRAPQTPNRAVAASLTPVFDVEPEVSSSAEPLDRDDDALLLEQAGRVLEAIQAGDYLALSQLVHPEKGVTLTPYSTVDLECNQMLTAQQVSALERDETVYTWGILDGGGEPIQMTAKEYFGRFVFNADYTQAPEVGIDQVLSVGNAMENVADVYGEGRFVEYHFPGLDFKREGYDWCSLKLVFEEYHSRWYLVGLIHSEWTI